MVRQRYYHRFIREEDLPELEVHLRPQGVIPRTARIADISHANSRKRASICSHSTLTKSVSKMLLVLTGQHARASGFQQTAVLNSLRPAAARYQYSMLLHLIYTWKLPLLQVVLLSSCVSKLRGGADRGICGSGSGHLARIPTGMVARLQQARTHSSQGLQAIVCSGSEGNLSSHMLRHLAHVTCILPTSAGTDRMTWSCCC